MEVRQGVSLTDGKNRMDHIIPLSTILSAYHENWNRIIPMNVGHDRTKPIGFTKLSGIYMEPGKAYLTNELAIVDSGEERKELLKMIKANDYRVFYEEHKDEIGILAKKLGLVLSDSRQVAPIGQAVAIKESGIIRRIFPEWVDTFKDGLTDIKELEPVYSKTDKGEKGHLIPGVFYKDGYLLFAHQFFRRSLSILNTTNEEFFIVFEKMRNIQGINALVALDMDIVGLPGTEHPQVEYQYIWGPHFNDNLELIPEGVTCFENEHYDNLYTNIVSTQFYWHKQDGKRSFECEELCDRENIFNEDGNTMHWGCRYVHSMIDPGTGLPIHLDGAIRIYDDEQIVERLDAKTDISKYGKLSKYIKLWRIDNEFSVALWKELISAFYRENPLIGEYFGGVDEKYERIKKEQEERRSEVNEPNDFEHIEINSGDGCRVFLQYSDRFEIEDTTDIRISVKESILFNDGQEIEIIDSETISLLKLLKRKGLMFVIPTTSCICFNDTICNFPTLYCKNEFVAGIVLESINELCQVWMNRGEDRLLSFGIMINQHKEAGHISIAGHVNDIVKFIKQYKRITDISLDEWILDIYQKNNTFRKGNNHPDKYALLHGDRLCFRRLIIQPNNIEKLKVDDGTINIKLRLSSEEKEYLCAHQITEAPFFRIKRDICCKCGKEYSQCDCIKYIDEGVEDVVVDADLLGLIWTNRRCFPNR